MRRLRAASIGIVALIFAGCSSGSSSTATTHGSTAVPGTSQSSTVHTEPPASLATETSSPLVGEWRRVRTCEELVEGFTAAGLESLIPEWLAGEGYVPGTKEEIAQRPNPCEGAVPREHSHFFTADGRFGSRDWRGETVDSGTYVLLDETHFRIGEGSGSVTLSFTITNDNIVFVPVVPENCATDECRKLIAYATTVAYPGLTWQRQTTSASSASGGGSDGAGSTYASTTFAVPFDVAVPAWLPSAPYAEEPNFVAWQANADDIGLKVRFLVPVNVYPPGGTGPTPPPQDYLAYLRGQSDYGAHFADVTEMTVGGRPATILTVTTDRSLDGSLGCQKEGMTAADCWGLQPGLILRIAVIPVGDETLLVWLRGDAGATQTFTAHLDSFEQMLANLRFR
jgi:hypothetical protein